MKTILPLSAAIFFVSISCKDPAIKEAIAAKIDSPVQEKITIPLSPDMQDGDIIFQSSMSGQSYAIQLATHSRYSHCGLLFRENGKWYVYEAVQPVKKTSLDAWITHGDGNHYVVKRLKSSPAGIDSAESSKLKAEVRKHLGKNYDLAFDWSDDKIYCSELVWKSYHEATGLEIGHTRPLGDYDLSNPIVKKKLKQRYGNNIPVNEPMISPGSIFESELLATVMEK